LNVALKKKKKMMLLQRAARRWVSHTQRKYARVEDKDVRFFEGVCSTVLTRDLESYNTDWMRKWQGQAQVVLRPSNTEEVSAVLRYCDERGIAVVPQGGNTGLVGASVPVYDEVVLSTRSMARIESFDEDSGIVKVEAGCILETMDAYLRERGFVAPLDLGAKGSCTVGGNASTNAGGVRFLRYGSLRGSVIGVEAVRADGTILDCGFTTAMRKDNTGYALHQLFLGSEGTLGVVTKLAIAAPPLSRAVTVALFATDSFDGVRQLLKLARRHLSEILSAVEFFDAEATSLVLKANPSVKDPLSPQSAFRVLVETSGANADHDRDKLEAFLVEADSQKLVVDGVVADTADKANRLWQLRENISDASTAAGYPYKYDVSLPLHNLYDLVRETRERLLRHDARHAVVCGYGHVGDSNLHLNVCSTTGKDDALLALLEPWLFDRVTAYHGSISAEHGVGRCKNDYLAHVKPAPVIATMRDLKHLLDPNAILNPYKLLPDDGRLDDEEAPSVVVN